MLPVHTRAYRSEDGEQVLRLLRQLWPGRGIGPGHHRRLDARLGDPRSAQWCAVDGHEVVGFAAVVLRESLWLDGEITYLSELVVDADRRGVGAGRLLVDAVRAWALAHGSRALELDCAHHRTAAHAFYRQCGFADRGLVFSLPLDPV